MDLDQMQVKLSLSCIYPFTSDDVVYGSAINNRHGPNEQHAKSAVGNLRNCGLRNAEGNLRNVICGATVIGQRVRPRDCSYSSVYHWPCVDSGEVKCIICMRKMIRMQRVGLI